MKNTVEPMPLTDIAEQLQVNKSMLEHYKKKGLLSPVKVFKNRSYLYDLNQVKRVLGLIEKGRKKGLLLEQIAAEYAGL